MFYVTESILGFGVGNASASATHALLLTVLQDAFSRLTSQYVPHRFTSFLILYLMMITATFSDRGCILHRNISLPRGKNISFAC